MSEIIYLIEQGIQEIYKNSINSIFCFIYEFAFPLVLNAGQMIFNIQMFFRFRAIVVQLTFSQVTGQFFGDTDIPTDKRIN